MARSFEAGRNNLLRGLGYTRYHMRDSECTHSCKHELVHTLEGRIRCLPRVAM